MNSVARLMNAIDYRQRAFLSRYYYGNRYFWQRYIRHRRFAGAMQKLAADAPELLQLINRMLAGMGRDPSRPSSRHSDALFLMHQMQSRRPKWILECGAGVSTGIFGYILNRLNRQYGHEGRVVSVDESADYIDAMVRPHVASEWARFVEIHPSPIGYWRFQNSLTGAVRYGIGYKHVPTYNYDFVYVDGPQVRQGAYQGIQKVAVHGGLPGYLTAKPFDCDMLNVLLARKDSGAVAVAIDQRIDTRWQLLSLLEPPYSARYFYGARKSLFVLSLANIGHIQRSDAGEPVSPRLLS